MVHTLELVVAFGSSVAAVVYVARQVHHLARVIDLWAGLPEAHAKLAEQTMANTRAIDRLTAEVRKLAIQERARGRRK